MKNTNTGVASGTRFLLLVVAIAALAASFAAALRAAELRPVVEVQEDVYQHEPADNGAGPLWCSGSTCLVRVDDDVFASGIETIAGQQPLNNCRWVLYRRQASGWQLLRSDGGRTREPCPLAVFPGQRKIFLSANPTVTPPEARNGAARPEILQFSANETDQPPAVLLPQWSGEPSFTEHSYRSFAADGSRGELFLCQNIGYTHMTWSFRDAEGKWAAGELKWPWGAEYDRPQPIRVCYPDVALVNRRLYFCGVSDIQEPYEAWRAHKKELTGQDWDYDFRRLFFTWSDDIREGEFHEWVEISSRDKTAGWIMPGDLWVGPDGLVHILWTERAIDERLQQKYFPDAKQSHSLNYAVIRDGQVIARRALIQADEGGSREVAGSPRFHVTASGRLHVVFFVNGRNAAGQDVSENRILELHPDGSASAPVRIPLDPPFTSFFTATVRAGSSPSPLVDLLGSRSGKPNTISYARIRVE